MKKPFQHDPARPVWAWFLVGGCAILILLVLLLRPRQEAAMPPNDSTPEGAGLATAPQGSGGSRLTIHRNSQGLEPTAQEILPDKVPQFARSPPQLAHALAPRHNVQVSQAAHRFLTPLS